MELDRLLCISANGKPIFVGFPEPRTPSITAEAVTSELSYLLFHHFSFLGALSSEDAHLGFELS